MKTLELQISELEGLAMEKLRQRIVDEVVREPQAVGHAIARRLRSVRDARHQYASNEEMIAAVINTIRTESPACANRIETLTVGTDADRLRADSP